MSLQDQVTADQQAIADAQAALDAANAKLAADQAALDAVQPHLSVLQEIEEFGANLLPESQAMLNALIARARSLF